MLRQAAAEQGYQASVTPFPEGEPEARLDDRPIAHVRFTADDAVRRDPLFGTILQRHTARQKFDTGRPVPDETLRDMSDIAFGQNAMSGFRSGTVTGATETGCW